MLKFVSWNNSRQKCVTVNANVIKVNVNWLRAVPRRSCDGSSIAVKLFLDDAFVRYETDRMWHHSFETLWALYGPWNTRSFLIDLTLVVRLSKSFTNVLELKENCFGDKNSHFENAALRTISLRFDNAQCLALMYSCFAKLFSKLSLKCLEYWVLTLGMPYCFPENSQKFVH